MGGKSSYDQFRRTVAQINLLPSYGITRDQSQRIADNQPANGSGERYRGVATQNRCGPWYCERQRVGFINHMLDLQAVFGYSQIKIRELSQWCF